MNIGAKKFYYIKRKSLLVFKDEARYAWEHSITTRKTDLVYGKQIKRNTRYSITLRKIKEGPCKCPKEYKAVCKQIHTFYITIFWIFSHPQS